MTHAAGSQFVLQMAGDPGTGKSALAQAIGHATGAVVLDKDIIKTAALNVGIEEISAQKLAYEAFFELARDLTSMGHSVVLDSPAYFTMIREKGSAIAKESGALYRIIECLCDDEAELVKRLRHRRGLASQLNEPVVDPFARDGCAPLTEPRLTIDMTRPLAECARKALDYLSQDTTAEPVR